MSKGKRSSTAKKGVVKKTGKVKPPEPWPDRPKPKPKPRNDNPPPKKPPKES